MPHGPHSSALAAAAGKVNRAMTDGVGGMQFTAQAPPGIGRLIRIPFYLLNAVNGFHALNGQQAAAITAITSTVSATHPAVFLFPPVAAGATVTAIMRTPQISWAILRVVGFEANTLDTVLPPTAPMEINFSDLQIGGGANLFVHEDFAPAGIYLMGQDSFAGLRDYPILRSPNTAEVSIQGMGLIASAGVTYSCNLVAEILTDDNYGSHIPGPYARPGALVRQGGSFVG